MYPLCVHWGVYAGACAELRHSIGASSLERSFQQHLCVALMVGTALREGRAPIQKGS